jgi:hypothetical protein
MKTPVCRALTVLTLAASAAAQAAPAPPRDELGRSVKLAILVDKVMQPEEGWVTKEWMVKEAAEAGFNVFSPRVGQERLDEVRQVAAWCGKYGLYHMPWMRGTLEAPDSPEAHGKRLVWAGGNEQPLWSPNSDEFWEWTTKYIVEYAGMSVELPNLMGVFLDYENYAKGKQGNCYSLSYDDLITVAFGKAKGLAHIEPDLAKRKAWLEQQGLHQEFEQFQLNHWRERCRALRRAVDERNPKFQFCLYPAPGTPFMVEACYPEWSTEAAPIILADPWVYGRPSRFLPQAEALEANRTTLLKGMEIPKAAGIPFLYSGGIDPVVDGADPEFCGKNAVMISEATGGYWIFYEGPKYKVDHPEYFKWFTWANKHLQQNALAAWHEPREAPEDFSLALFDDGTKRPAVVAPPGTGEKVEYPTVRMRRDNLLLLGCKAGQPVEVVLRNHPVGSYQSLLVWDLRTPKLEKLASGTIPHDSTGAVTFTPDADGLCLLGASAGSCAYSVVSANVPVGLYAGESLAFIHAAERLYFRVPEGVTDFTLTLRGSGGETVRANVFDPEGNQAATGQTTLAEMTTQVKVTVGAHAGRTWALQLTKADEGTLEDNSITLDPKLPPTLSLVEGQVFDLSR